MADGTQKPLAYGAVQMKDGTLLELPEQVIHRVVYALTSLAVTPVIDHVMVEAVFDGKGKSLWPGQELHRPVKVPT